MNIEHYFKKSSRSSSEAAASFGNVLDADIAKFEVANQIRLPDDYRQFLHQFNGGVLKRHCVIRFPGRTEGENRGIVKGLHGLYYDSIESERIAPYQLDKTNAILEDRILSGSINIADDPFGNCFLLFGADSGLKSGQVYFWDHEYEPIKIDPDQEFENITFVANSFTEFFQNLVYEPEE